MAKIDEDIYTLVGYSNNPQVSIHNIQQYAWCEMNVSFIMNKKRVTMCGWMDGWMDGWLDGMS